MVKSLLIIVAFIAVSFAQDNWNGWGDTAKITNFYADTTIYSKWFTMSQFSILRFSLYLNDTSTAGFDSDSCAAEWGIQTGHISFLTTDVNKKKILLGKKIICDTMNTTAGGVFTVDSAAMTTIDTDGWPLFTKKRIDTLVDSFGRLVRAPYAYQTSCPINEWNQSFRFWIHGLTGNKNTKNLKGYFQSARQTGIKVNND